MNNNWSILLGFWIWLGITFWLMPLSMFNLNYVQVLILAAPLWLIPIVLKLSNFSENIQLFALPSAAALAFSFLFETGFTNILSIPWLIFTIFLAWKKLLRLIHYQDNKFQKTSPVNLIETFPYLFLPVGAAWAVFDRLNYQPFNFDSTIVLLTAAHFHYAGFLLLFLGSRISRFYAKNIQRILAIGLITGMPLVAIGITTTHYNLPTFIETFGVIIMASSGMLVGFLHIKTGWNYQHKIFGWLWMIAGFALVSGMSLAILYDSRSYMSISFLTIPYMYAIHGTLNAIGFAIPGIIGWYLFDNQSTKS